MDTKPTERETIAQEARAFAESIVDTVREPLLVLDEGLRVVTANRSFRHVFRVSPEETKGTRVYELGNGQWDIPELRQLLEEILPHHTYFEDFEVRHTFPAIGDKVMLLNARKLYYPGDELHDRSSSSSPTMILLAFEDVTERHAEEARLQAAYDREHLIAEALQRPLTLEVPEDAFPGLAVATLYEAALQEAQVGGDFFDIFAMPRGRVAVAIADASGKGLSAAVRTMQLKDVLRAFTREYPHSPAAIVARLNDFMCDTRRFDLDKAGEESFSCLSLAILDPDSGEGSLVTAGCEPALIVHAGGTSDVLTASGPPLGIEREEIYAARPFHLDPGDTLLLVTDGITEARRGKEFLEYEGLAALAKEALGQPLPSLRDAAEVILNGARSFGGGSLRDDACIVLVRRL